MIKTLFYSHPTALVIMAILWCFLNSCNEYVSAPTESKIHGSFTEDDPRVTVTIKDTIRIKNYFKFIDDVVGAHNSSTDYKLTERLLVHANPWVIDSLEQTDYYRAKERGLQVYDQKEMIILKPGQLLEIPTKREADQLLKRMQKTYLDINIPEFRLRIIEDTAVLYSLPIRVGQHRVRYLELGKGKVDLRTKTGSGTVVAYRRQPVYYNPVDGKHYVRTRRDDGYVSMMPWIPSTELEINGVRNGQLIHATTNPVTLEKAYSNGCIGTTESDAWLVYYYSQLGTPVQIRYTLQVEDSGGEVRMLEDIYGRGAKQAKN